jgi:hypothetical protein
MVDASSSNIKPVFRIQLEEFNKFLERALIMKYESGLKGLHERF